MKVVSQPEEEEIPIQEAIPAESAVEENASPEETEEEPTLAQLLETEGAEISVTRDRAAAASTGKRMLKAAAVGQSGTLRVGYNSYSNNVGYLESIKSTIYQLPSKTLLQNGYYVAAYCLEEAKAATPGHGYTSTNLTEILGQERASLIGDILAQGFQYSGSSGIPQSDTYKWAITQLIGLRWSDWDKERKVLLIRKSKTAAGMRAVPVIPELAYILTHLESLRKAENPPQIFTYTGRGMPKGTCEQMPSHHLRWICEKTARLADVRHVHPHMLRHTFASRMVENKVDIKSLATIIGHTDPAFTLRQYVDVDETEHLYKEMMRISTFGKNREN